MLGTLEVEDDGIDLTPVRPKQRALLVLLLLREGVVVGSEELMEALWGERRPKTAPTALHGLVSALRKRLGAVRIETRLPGYRLRLLDGDEVDVRRFEDAVAEARVDDPAARSQRLGEALSLFRGDPLSDVRYDAFARNETARLAELRLTAMEEQNEADLELGLQVEVVPRLERLVAAHPLRERLRGQLMVALYRAGRQADALHAFQQARVALVAELGIDPGPALRRLERQILNQEPELAGTHRVAPHSGAPTIRPAGIVTFLVAREVSTRLPLGQTEGSVPDPHRLDELVREAVDATGGFVSSVVGGRVLAAFVRARDAVAASLAIQRAAGATGDCLRVGIHSAEEISASEGYAGPGVRRASGVCDAAHGGQILLSQTSRDLLRESPSWEAAVRALGAHRLSDLQPAQRLYQLVSPGLKAEFPPVRSLEHRTTNLALQSAPLVGRAHELRTLSELLSEATTRVVTLTGAGGVGKTRLAVQLAAELMDEFPDGVFFVDLAPLPDSHLVLSTVARTIGIREQDDETLAAALGACVRGRRLLLVLDNFEHVLEAAVAIEFLASPTTRVLATSRAPLRLASERVHPIAPLDLPTGAEGVDRLLGIDSVALFVARAQAVRPEFTVTASNASAISGICTALDGLPLAIELAATRVGVLPPATLLTRLDQRLEVLGGGNPGAPDRHRTVRATIDWSYDLLESSEQILFVRLAVFAGGCTLEAAEAVCGDGLDLVNDLASLVETSLVRLGGTDTAPRFAMLETIREYAAGRLAESDESEQLRRRHAERFLTLAEEAEPHLRGNPGVWLDRLESERDNLRAALDRFVVAGERELVLRLAGALWRFWYLRGYLTEGRRRLEDALAAGGRPTPARAKALIGAAVTTLNAGDPAAASRWAEEGLALNRELGDQWGIAYSLFMLGNAIVDRSRAQVLYSESIQLFCELGDEHSLLLASRSLAWSCEDLGDRERSRALHVENLRHARASGNGRIEASTLGELATIAVREGRVDDALSMLKDGLRIHRHLGDLLDTAVDLCRLADILAFDGQATTAAVLLSSFEAAGEAIGARRAGVKDLNERTLATIRTLVDDVAFAEAWERGRGLSIDAAVAFALETRTRSTATERSGP